MIPAIYRLGVQHSITFPMVQSSDHITPYVLGGNTCTLTISKNGAAFVSATNSVSDGGNGWMTTFLVPDDLNILGDISFHASASGADPVDWNAKVEIKTPGNNDNYMTGPGAAGINLDASGNWSIASPLKQNQPYNGLTFVMTKASDGTAMTGLTVTALRSLAGGVFASCLNNPTELSNGVYSLNLAAQDTNASALMLRLTATGANDLNIPMITQP